MTFYGNAQLIVGGNTTLTQDFEPFQGSSVWQQDTFPMGTTAFILPNVDSSVKIRVTAGYVLANEQGNGGTINIPH